MREIKLLLEDYQRRLKTITKKIGKISTLTLDKLETKNRLETKASCYRTFISELERTLETVEKLSGCEFEDGAGYCKKKGSCKEKLKLDKGYACNMAL